jgi:hypothetical protein
MLHIARVNIAERFPRGLFEVTYPHAAAGSVCAGRHSRGRGEPPGTLETPGDRTETDSGPSHGGALPIRLAVLRGGSFSIRSDSPWRPWRPGGSFMQVAGDGEKPAEICASHSNASASFAHVGRGGPQAGRAVSSVSRTVWVRVSGVKGFGITWGPPSPPPRPTTD